MASQLLSPGRTTRDEPLQCTLLRGKVLGSTLAPLESFKARLLDDRGFRDAPLKSAYREDPASSLDASRSVIAATWSTWTPTIRRLVQTRRSVARVDGGSRSGAAIGVTNRTRASPRPQSSTASVSKRTSRRCARSRGVLRGVPGASALGRGLARRLAPRVFVEDQGRVQVHVGDDCIPGSDVRRKVLALLCFLLSRPKCRPRETRSSTRSGPTSSPMWRSTRSTRRSTSFGASSSRPSPRTSTPGYVHHDSDVLWLDSGARRRVGRCSRESQSAPPSTIHRRRMSSDLSATYRGRFALDFAYEEWAVAYRDSMHAAYLEIIERAVIGGHASRCLRSSDRPGATCH